MEENDELGRKNQSCLPAERSNDVVSFAKQRIKCFKEKADHNKDEAMGCYKWIAILSCSGPLLLIPDWGSILKGIAAALELLIIPGWTPILKGVAAALLQLVVIPEWGSILKGIAATLPLAVAALTGWLQLRQPHSLWRLYRGCQRRIENELDKYTYKLGEYEAADEKGKTTLLADAVRDVCWDAHEKWVPLVPSPEQLSTIKGNKQPTGVIEHDKPRTSNSVDKD
jgi:hypothetical protein